MSLNPHSHGYDPLTRSPLPGFPPITPEDLAKLGVESQLISFIISTASEVEQSLDGPFPLSPVEAQKFVEILDKVHPTT